MAASAGELPVFDTTTANAARMWNYWIGGKGNFARNFRSRPPDPGFESASRGLADRGPALHLGRGRSVPDCRRMMSDLAPGSYLVIAHAASDISPRIAADVYERLLFRHPDLFTYIGKCRKCRTYF